jgi:hypothetical protein
MDELVKWLPTAETGRLRVPGGITKSHGVTAASAFR